MTTATTNIWSFRFTPALGNHWKLERECNIGSVNVWLQIFRADDPDHIFVATKRKPPVK